MLPRRLASSQQQQPCSSTSTVTWTWSKPAQSRGHGAHQYSHVDIKHVPDVAGLVDQLENAAIRWPIKSGHRLRGCQCLGLDDTLIKGKEPLWYRVP